MSRYLVNNTVKEAELITDNLANPPKEILTRGQSISDKVARFGGSWKFIIYFCCFLLAWIILNSSLPGSEAFDPYPFILMNLILSCVAALQAPIIMMSQNRKEEKDRMRSENDYLINLKAEVEIRSLHQKIDLLLEEQMKQLYQHQVKQLELLQQIQMQINKAS
ncbi:DUF1003 domain-containing protein [Adhaeribacter pallidiroseus]|uniref:Cyclic nucleotide-binding protein n=1 Tax=Adhaeribacter pallidiroseus TaxID=2072847 RepID=A0A369QJ55_9BACT|nr:DUF1003 domain-containing protein [Adhaeribacter pallidiroseus]RDC64432.1 hypothetical protein AHMF7616_03046 [Adhaeribacter pallidiroseus]